MHAVGVRVTEIAGISCLKHRFFPLNLKTPSASNDTSLLRVTVNRGYQIEEHLLDSTLKHKKKADLEFYDTLS